MLKSFQNLTRFERGLWLVSVAAVLVSAIFGGKENLPSALCSLIGVTALIFIARGDVLGQILSIAFALLYGIISLTFSYYGEVLTYLGMSLPMALLSLISWLRHPYKTEECKEVAVGHVGAPEAVLMLALAGVVTSVFYFLLKMLGTANLGVSTLSVATSFVAAYLTFRRSPYYAIGYAANDLVLIVLWILAAAADLRYLSMVVCFVMFLLNDLYGFVSWQRMRRRQEAGK